MCYVCAGPWLDNYISLTSSRLSSMQPETQANLLSSLAVWKAQLSPAWLAMFQLLCVKEAEEGSMTADQLEQVGVLCCAVLGACTGWLSHTWSASSTGGTELSLRTAPPDMLPLVSRGQLFL